MADPAGYEAVAPPSGVREGVSVAIAAYNGAEYLGDLLDSILRQTAPAAEIVCADDASTDDTPAVLARYAEKSPIPFTIIRHEKNVGVVRNFLSAFRATSGEYIAYCDQDDVWEDRKLEVCLREFERPGVSMVCHSSIITDGRLNATGKVEYRIPRDVRTPFPNVFGRVACWGHQIVFDRTSLEALLELYECDAFRNSELGACFDWGIPFAASLTGEICFKREPLIKFRRHPRAISGAGSGASPSPGRLASRVAARSARIARRASQLGVALSTLEACPCAQAKAPALSRKAYADCLSLMRRRVALANTDGLTQRLAMIPNLLIDAGRQHRIYKNFELKEAAGDFLTALLGPTASAAAH